MATKYIYLVDEVTGEYLIDETTGKRLIAGTVETNPRTVRDVWDCDERGRFFPGNCVRVLST